MIARYPRIAIATACTLLMGSCSLLFSPADLLASLEFPWPPDTPLKTATRSELTVIIEDPNRLAVLHGLSCAQSDRDGQEDFVRVQERLNFIDHLREDARWITDATVFLNGWHGRFLDDNHSLLGVAAAIARIEHRRTELTFEGGGALSDPQFNAAYEICYTYTVLAWNRAQMTMSADHGDMANTFVLLQDDNPAVSSLNVLRNYREGLSFLNSNTPAGVLPRGFGMAWGDKAHLLQAAYSMAASSNIRTSTRHYGQLPSPTVPDLTTLAGEGGISWDSSLIFKPNDMRQDIYVAELVSILGGASMTMIEPPFSIEPANEGTTACGAAPQDCGMAGPDDSGPQTREITIGNLPFAHAVPVLRGWSLGYAKSEHSIRDLGISIDSFSYTRDPGRDTGVLRYTVTAEADNGGGFQPALLHSVGVLGFDPQPLNVTGDDPSPGYETGK